MVTRTDQTALSRVQCNGSDGGLARAREGPSWCEVGKSRRVDVFSLSDWERAGVRIFLLFDRSSRPHPAFGHPLPGERGLERLVDAAPHPAFGHPLPGERGLERLVDAAPHPAFGNPFTGWDVASSSIALRHAGEASPHGHGPPNRFKDLCAASFHKKSKSGIETPKHEVALIRQRSPGGEGAFET